MASLDVSVYRLRSNKLLWAVRNDLDDAELHRLALAGYRAIRVDRVSEDRPPEWAPALAAMTGRPFAHSVRSAGALLLIDLGDVAYALAFGTGWYMLKRDAWEPDFGLRVALRTLRPDRIAEVTRSALGPAARLDLTHMPGGTSVRTFAIEQYAEIVKKIGGRCDTLDITYLKGRRRHVKLDGRDALRVRIAVDPSDLINDLVAIDRASKLDPAPELAFVEGIRPLGDNDHRLGAAERALRDELARPTTSRVGLDMPVGLLGVDVSRYEVEVEGDTKTVDSLDLDVIVGLLARVPADRRLDALDTSRVAVHAEGQGEPLVASLDEWIAADLTVGHDRYVYQGGQFYIVTDEYRNTLVAEATRLMEHRPHWTLPPWRSDVHEDAYNKEVGTRPGFASLDRTFAYTTTHPSGIEICDLVSPDNQLVCVKRAEKSAPLSHLFSQAIVAAEALCDGDETYENLLAMIPEDRRAAMPRRPEFVFAIQLTKGDLTPGSLFTFSQVTLHRAARHLHRLGMNIFVVAIPSE